MGPATTDNKPLCQLEGIQFGADAAMCVGYHSKAGTRGGLLAHTFIGSLIADLRMNGKSVGEVEVNAAVLSSFGIPLAMISGNSDLESEIRQWNTSSVFVSTKTTLGPTAAICYSPQTTAAMLRKGASESISNLQNWHLHSLGEVSFEVDTKHPEQLCRAIEHPGVTHVAANTFAVEGPSASEAFRHLWSACLAALGELPQWLR
jgi:D-amino peptidase